MRAQDVCVRLRTAFLYHGYLVTSFHQIFLHYLRGWLVPDTLSALPFDLVVQVSNASPTVVDFVRLLRVLRIGRLVRKMAGLSSANVVLVISLILSFVLFAHWLGLGYYLLAIRPLENLPLDDLPQRDWIWGNETVGAVRSESYLVAVRCARARAPHARSYSAYANAVTHLHSRYPPTLPLLATGRDPALVRPPGTFAPSIGL